MKHARERPHRGEAARVEEAAHLADSKRELRNVLDAHGFAAARPFTRMLYGSSARFDDDARTFAVVGPEFG